MNFWTQSETNILVAGHRGFSETYPENTLESFQAALDLGVDILETDVRVTRDDQLVLFHDSTLDRTTNGTGLVCEHTLEELKALDAGNGYRIPTLMEFLQLVKGYPQLLLNIELKELPVEGKEEQSYRLCDRVLGILEEQGWLDRCVIATWSGKLHEYINDTYGSKWKQQVFYPKRCLGEVTRDPYHYAYSTCVFGVQDGSTTVEDMRNLREETGVRLWAGPDARDEASIDRVIAVGTEIITCNNPDEVLEILRRKNLHR